MSNLEYILVIFFGLVSGVQLINSQFQQGIGTAVIGVCIVLLFHFIFRKQKIQQTPLNCVKIFLKKRSKSAIKLSGRNYLSIELVYAWENRSMEAFDIAFKNGRKDFLDIKERINGYNSLKTKEQLVKILEDYSVLFRIMAGEGINMVAGNAIVLSSLNPEFKNCEDLNEFEVDRPLI